LGASLWGTDTVLRRPLTADLASSQIVLFEHLILTLVLLPAAWRARAEWRALKGVEWAALLGIAWGGSACGTLLFTEAIRIGSPTTAVLLQKMQPLFAALLAWVLLREALGVRFWFLLLAAVVGACLVSFGAPPWLPTTPQAGRSGALLALAAAALWGTATVLGRFVLRRLSFPALTALRIILATPLLALVAAAHWPAVRAPLGTRQAISLLLLALVPGLAGTLIYYRGLAHTLASRAAVAELSFPVVATLLNWALLSTPVSAVQLAGFALLWGVILNLQVPIRVKDLDGHKLT
jgi:drug/metabolite transporter (DMT)-like permease